MPVAVDGQRLALAGVADDQRDQLLRELAGAVVVRAVGDQRRQAVRVVGGAHQVVGGGLRRGVGAVRRVGRRLAKRRVVGPERAVDLVGRDVQEAEGGAARGVEPLQVRARRVEQRLGAEDVRAQERRRVVDRAVDVGLGGEVDEGRRAVLGEQARHQRRVADVAADELVAGVAGEAGQVLRVSGVGQRVEIDDARPAPGARQPDERRADEARAAGDDPDCVAHRRPPPPLPSRPRGADPRSPAGAARTRAASPAGSGGSR